MKLIPFFVGLCMLAACSNQKNTNAVATASNTTTETTSENYRIIGVVHVSDTGCKLYIDAQEKDKKVKMYPVNLDEKFQKEGMRLKFDYAASRAPLPDGCDAAQVVSVSDVTPMRGN